jgi:glycosyltransferase involved in cell wall biosynthesis
LKILITSSYNKGATLNRVIGYINCLSGYHEVECILPASETKLTLPPNAHYLFIPYKNDTSRNFAIRYWQEFKFGLKAAKIQCLQQPDIEIITVPFIALIITSIFKQRPSRKILDVRDLVWEYLTGNVIIKLLKAMIKVIHVFYINRYDYLIATNDHEIQWLKQHTRFEDPILINNGILIDQFKRIKSLKVKPITDIFEIIYTGNVGIAQNLVSFIKAIEHNHKVRFTIVGDGNDLDRIQSYINEQKILNVVLRGRVSQEEIFYFYEQADILYAKLDDNFTTAIPSKLYEYLATNKPIIYSGKGAAIDFLKSFDNVYLCKDDYFSLEKLINTLVRNGVSSSLRNQDKIEEGYIRETLVRKKLGTIIIQSGKENNLIGSQ